MIYFAYGSNLSSVRLRQRVPSAEFVATGQLRKHRLLFHKIGMDGSAKCDAFLTGRAGDILYGALYRIDPEQKEHLDLAEGLGNGYEEKQVTIVTGSAGSVAAFTYYATRTTAEIKPFHWYKEHVLFGAREHCLPGHYIEKIALIPSINDEDSHRTKQEQGIYLSAS